MYPNKFNHSPLNPRQMRINGRCPVCQAMYDFANLQVLGEREQAILVYLECSVCQASIISILSLDPRGMSAQGMVTDLDPEEIFEFEAKEPVLSDDVLAVHQYLEEDQPVDNFLK